MNNNHLGIYIIYKDYLFFTLFLFLINISTYCQTTSGKILDTETQKPIENVNVFLTKNKSIGTTSNENGEFTLKFKLNFNQNDSISFSMIGYNTFSTSIRFLKENNRIVYLSKSSEILEEITVNGKIKQRTLKFKKINSLPINIFSFSSIIINNKIYISGGDKTIEDNSFQRGVERGTAGKLAPTFLDVQTYWYSSRSFKKYNEKLLIYNLETNTWANTNITLENRAYHQMNNYKDDLYILGGKKLSSYKTTEYLHDKIEVFNKNEKTGKVTYLYLDFSVEYSAPH